MPELDIPTLIFAILAIVVAVKLRSVLGTRNGAERPPVGPAPGPANSNVVPMLGLARKAASAAPAAPWKDVAEPGTPLANGLDAIAAVDSDFTAAHFLQGAKAAYEIIVTAFAAGDEEALRPMLAPDVLNNFSQAIRARAAAGQKMTTSLVAMDSADIVDAQMSAGLAHVAVRFNAKLISATRDAGGAIVEGSAAPADHVDIWTFQRAPRARDPNWSLGATQTIH